MARSCNDVPYILLFALPLLIIACDQDVPTRPERVIGQQRISASGMTTADSAAYLLNGEPMTFATAAVTSISLLAGDSVYVTVVSADCSGDPETVRVYGVISGTIASSSCQTLPGTVVKVGPATSDGTISFRATHHSYGEGPSGQVSGSFPNYTIGMNDGYGDTDYNDVIISVQVVYHCASTGDPVIDHRDFKSRYDSLMKVSKIDSAAGRRHEWGMTVVLDQNSPNGVSINWPQVEGSACMVEIPYNPATTIALIHSHPYFDREMGTCMDPVPYLSDLHGGGSPEDWSGPLPMYAATPQWIFKFDPSTPVDDRWKNPWRYERTSRGCFVRNPIFPF